MEDRQATNKPDWYECITNQHNGGRSPGHCFPDVGLLTIHDPFNVDPAEAMDVQAKKGSREYKHEEEAVIPLHHQTECSSI